MLPDCKNPTAPEPRQERVTVDLAELDRQRLARGWSRTRLAAQMGTSRAPVDALYKNGWTSPATAAKLWEALDRTPPSAAALLLAEGTEGAA